MTGITKSANSVPEGDVVKLRGGAATGDPSKRWEVRPSWSLDGDSGPCSLYYSCRSDNFYGVDKVWLSAYATFNLVGRGKVEYAWDLLGDGWVILPSSVFTLLFTAKGMETGYTYTAGWRVVREILDRGERRNTLTTYRTQTYGPLAGGANTGNQEIPYGATHATAVTSPTTTYTSFILDFYTGDGVTNIGSEAITNRRILVPKTAQLWRIRNLGGTPQNFSMSWDLSY